MIKLCKCCNNAMTGSKCNYCGFVEITDLDDAGADFIKGMASSHKQKIVSALTDFSVVSYNYKWNPGKSRLELDRKEEVKLADGRDCYPNISWASQNFGQLPAGEGKDLTLELSYKFRGVQKRISCTLPTIQCDDFWRLGLQIDQSLKLKILLGTTTKHTESVPYALDLKY